VNILRSGEAGPGPNRTIMGATFELDGQGFMVLNGGPEFTLTPAMSVNWPKLLVMIRIGAH